LSGSTIERKARVSRIVADAGPEGGERPLTGLVGRRAGDGRVWYQREESCPLATAPTSGERDPDADHRPAVSSGEVSEASEGHRQFLYLRCMLTA
jgi:hypothetical protein